ncbi:TrkH family potassium uptake protein [Pseudoroseomonas ludipueritiae]|uniref:TrkH family potassium uptake protein n=1 Tax=Pseudoroseomonas ludipueritiae TaxID=198093 RepID=A0ABR7R4F6_9PROT|nr:potassium transporter TrkG [Pseudoroseomonas ludipueritiae]MBC9176660.1 TrkH family potassium uptake protein [Pseudoroseomonas ludipueritiae]MCG7360780.1 TrkH family potassium uptake protein [Roseomonas sp. ACRSG]
MNSENRNAAIRTFRHPARLLPLAFLLAILLGTALLMLPAARPGPEGASLLAAAFTATSAVTVTGLAVRDTGTYWSGFGQAVIVALSQLGGLGIMSGATLLGMLVTRRLSLSTRLLAQAEIRVLALGDVLGVLRLILLMALCVEAATAMVLALRLRFGHGLGWAEALWSGTFHAVGAFNNAGFSLYPDGLMRFAADPLVLGPLMLAVTVGGLGFPVVAELLRAPARLSLHSRLTLLGTAGLLLLGTLGVLAFEWSNPRTLGGLEEGPRLLGAAFHSVMTRSGGFNAVDTGQMTPGSLVLSYLLMLIGGGSAGTAGGIRVTTFLVLGLIVWAEVRGDPDVTAFRRRIPADLQRQALTVATLAATTVALATLALLAMTDLPTDALLFEVISAFATVGLSTGITGTLPPAGQALLMLLMFVGRVGTVTVVTALALRGARRLYRYPEERPIVG